MFCFFSCMLEKRAEMRRQEKSIAIFCNNGGKLSDINLNEKQLKSYSFRKYIQFDWEFRWM